MTAARRKPGPRPPPNPPRRRNIAVPKVELLERIERLQKARRLIDEELRELTAAYITPEVHDG